MGAMMDGERRNFLKTGALGLLTFKVGSVSMLLTPRQARCSGADFDVLTTNEVAALEAIGETLVPGAAEAGIAHFVDKHLASKPQDSLLVVRYLDLPPPYLPLYQAGLAALDALSMKCHDAPFAGLDSGQREAVVATMSKEDPDGWQGPPASLMYFVWRSDGVDVVYGTPEGFDKLGFPYMPHIMPGQNW